MTSDDLQIERISQALAGLTLDVVVSGSIGAVESVRFVRALRRIGATVEPWLTAGGAQFITPMALAWAAARPARTAFSGDASHIALGDACIVAPASASMIAKIAQGLTDTPAAALVTSYLGQGKPVLVLPNMHESLAAAPSVATNIRTLEKYGVHVLGARMEEGKRKFPAPDALADEVAHRVLRVRRGIASDAIDVLVTMGTTRGYIDDVRYLSNYSSGALGSRIAEELYRLGLNTEIVCGPCPIKPRVATRLVAVETNDQMKAAAKAAVEQHGARAAVMAASVLDYAPRDRQKGKISSQQTGLTIVCEPTEKIIAQVAPSLAKVGFKLESGLTADRAAAIAKDYMAKYGLSLFVANDLSEVDASKHRALVFTSPAAAPREVEGKLGVAEVVAGHVAGKLGGAP